MRTKRRDSRMENILHEVCHHGVARYSEVAPDSTGKRAIAELIARGQLIRRGPVIHIPGADEALIIACRERALLTCGAALPYLGLADLLPASPIHLAVPANRGVLPTGVCVHRENGLIIAPSQLVVPYERLASRLLRCAPHREAIALVDQMLNSRTILRGDIEALLGGNQHGCAGARRLLTRCSDRARSPIESLARVDLEDAGHTVEPGVIVEGVGEVDLIVDHRLVVETDGYTYHRDPDTWKKDRWRDQQMLARGVITLRLTYADVMANRTVDLVRSALSIQARGRI